MTPLTVVKLGGSHAFSAHLACWIESLERLAGSIVIVPGGGPFADAVRNAQPRMGFNDDAAHVMAMLAMTQYGNAIAGLADKLVVVNSLAAIRGALRACCVPVWSPIPMALRDPAIAKSWSVTSDTLALWLAQKLRAHRLVLVKHELPLDGRRSANELSADGLVDAAFPAMYCERVGGNWISGPDGYRSIEANALDASEAMIRIIGQAKI